jgi:hypothetical protein
MFTIAALLTLGTTFIAISIGEGRQAEGDKYSQLARGVSLYGINWITSYMALPTAWKGDVSPDPGQSSDTRLYVLRPTDGSNHIAWMGRTLDLAQSNNSDGTYTWNVGVLKSATGATGAEVPLVAEGLVGLFRLKIEKLSAAKAGQEFLKGQPSQYAVTSTAYVFPNTVTRFFTSDDVVDAAAAKAIRTITMRIRPQNPLDFALYEANMRSWNIPGFNTQFGLNNFSDNGLGTIDIDQNHYDPNDPAAQQRYRDAQNEYQLLQNMYQQVQLDSVGIPVGYQMKGNFRADGSITPGDPFAQKSGSIHVFASTDEELKSIAFTGDHTSFVKENIGYDANKYDGSFSQSQMDSIFKGANGATYSDSRGLPPTGDYMTSYLADTSEWPTPDPNDPTQSHVNVPTADTSTKHVGRAADLAQGGIGYIKVSTPPTGAVPVNSSTTQGSDIEILDPNSGGPGVQQPGFAKIKISVTPDPNNPADGIVTIQKVGAYSGLPVDTSDPPFDGPHKVSEFKNGTIYVDGGNVEVSGNIQGKLTIVAAASSDRPTVATPATKDRDGNLVPQPGLPVLIPPSRQAEISTSIYRPSSDPIFHRDGDGKITNIPAYDSATSKWYFPAYDPTKVGVDSGNPSAVTSEAPLTREGNVTIVGDLTKAAGSNSALGIVAQNYVLLSDQTANKKNLQVDATLMSMQRSVQYGGFLTADGSNGVNAYYQAMGTDADANGKVRGNLPRPRTKLKGDPGNLANSPTFTLNGSIIAQYADVEASKSGDGYLVQHINADPGLRSTLPPNFPNFARDQVHAPIIWVVVALTDSSTLKQGVTSTPSP